MFGIYTGVIVNAVLVVIGTAIGCIFKTEKLKTIGERVMQGFGLFTVMMGVSGALDQSHPLFILISLIIGISIGEITDLDGKFTKLAEFLKNKFAKNDSGFVNGFISAIMVFCIGSMTIMGALQSGLENTHTIYYTKGVLDGFGAITFAMGAGPGVGFAALIVLIYQGALVALAGLIQPIMTTEVVALSVSVGSLSLLALGLNILKITNIKVANFLPAMFVPIVYQAIVLAFGLNSLI